MGKLAWNCGASATDTKMIAPQVDHMDTLGHAQGYRKSTGQRTQGNEPWYNDERTSCSTTADVTGFKPSCLVHSYDQPPATQWGAHALQDGPDITITVDGTAQNWPSNSNNNQKQHVCRLTATDPYGASTSMTVTITVDKELNSAPQAKFRTGGQTTYT